MGRDWTGEKEKDNMESIFNINARFENTSKNIYKTDSCLYENKLILS